MWRYKNYISFYLDYVTITGTKDHIFISLKILLMTTVTILSVIIMLALIIIFLFRQFVLQKKNVSGELFAEALRNENSGHFETAIETYERALNEARKIRFQDNSLEIKITEKLKVLHTVMEYKNGFHPGKHDRY